MPETDRWLKEYGENHQDVRNPAIYWTAVPMLVVATVGMMWALPVPQEFSEISPVLNWGSAFLMAALVYYFIISVSLAIGMLPFVFVTSGFHIWLAQSSLAAAPVSAGLFLLSIVGLFIGQRRNGGNKAVFQDIQMLMIAPVWLLSQLYRRLGIPY